MDLILDFFSFKNPNVVIVSLGLIFLGLSSAIVGSFTFLRKNSLVGDAIAHAILPGIALAFMITQSKNPFYLMIGALISGWLAMISIDLISQKSKLKNDTAIGLVLSVFFGVGILLLTSIQHSGASNQAGLDSFLFGKAASMSIADIKAYSWVASILLLCVLVMYKEFKLLCFNSEFAQISGLPVKSLRIVLSSLTVLAIAIGIQSVGVVLMAALLITPSAAARAWTEKLSHMILFAGLAGALSGLTGAFISFSAPSMPTGPWIVVCLSLFALFSLFFAPKRGVLARVAQQKKNKKKIITENLMKVFYHHFERTADLSMAENQIGSERKFKHSDLDLAIRIAQKEDLLIYIGSRLKMSQKGFVEAQRIVRLHRLWEMYLTQKMRLKADHIHPNAETIEHIISPEIEELLLKDLGYPEFDPHESPIPYPI